MMILVVEIMHLYVLQSCKHKIFMRIANIYVHLQAGCIIMIKTKYMITNAKFEFID